MWKQKNWLVFSQVKNENLKVLNATCNNHLSIYQNWHSYYSQFIWYSTNIERNASVRDGLAVEVRRTCVNWLSLNPLTNSC